MRFYLKYGSIIGGIFLAISIICILFIDKPLAIYIHSHGLYQLSDLRYITEKLPISYAFFAIILILISPVGQKLLPKLFFLVYCILLVILTLFIKTELKIYLGREWVMDWAKASISLIDNNIYGFYGKHPNNWQGSYPSGHTTLTSVISFILIIIEPRYKYLWISLIGIITFALVILDFHFLGDCFAGIALGGICAYYLLGFYFLMRNKFKYNILKS